MIDIGSRAHTVELTVGGHEVLVVVADLGDRAGQADHRHDALRTVLDDLLGGDHGLHRLPGGQPRLHNGPHVSTSHTRTWLAVGLADVPVGIDIEADPAPDAADLSRFLHPDDEAEVLAAPPHDRSERFRALWTRLEAVLKAAGTGFDGSPLPEVGQTSTTFLGHAYELTTSASSQIRPFTLSAACLSDGEPGRQAHRGPWRGRTS